MKGRAYIMNKILTDRLMYTDSVKPSSHPRTLWAKTQIIGGYGLHKNKYGISELDEVRAKKSDTVNAFYEIESNRNALLKVLDEIKAKRDESDKKQAEFNLKINNLDSEYRIKDARRKFLVETEKEKEGYVRTVKYLLQDIETNSSLNKGVCGVLANLISVEQEYETAIEMALGGAIQNIVTETENEAKKLVNHLRENNLGRASFLPISSVKESKLGSYKKTGINGVIGIASDLVETS